MNKQFKNELKATKKLFDDNHVLVISKSGEMYVQQTIQPKKKSNKIGLSLFLFSVALAVLLFFC